MRASIRFLPFIVVAFAIAVLNCGTDPQVGEFPAGDGSAGDGSTLGTGGGYNFNETGTKDACGDACGPAAVCGDGVIGPGEECDDGNGTPGDGCSGVCKLEKGYTCPTAGKPCVPTFAASCGDGKIEGEEACDDGNKIDGDGCSAGCAVEPGYACTVPGKPCGKVGMGKCGDGRVNAGEQCDDGGNVDNDGCSHDCKIEPGFTCPMPGSPCVALEYCGDGVVEGAIHETCDDGNAKPGDGCSGLCTTENGYSCPTPGAPCVRVWVCGNGKVDPGEACDDGNTTPNDGCAPDCSFVEPGYTCPKAPDGTGGTCTKLPGPACGDGVLGSGEQCDDGNKTPGDGCSATCTTEPGYDCKVPGMACVKIAFCGDGKTDVQLGEECDDGVGPQGVPVSGDGCSATCTLEPNYVCPVDGKPCVSTVKCGDGRISGTEQCDDGNQLSNDGCSSTCQLEAGWSCGAAAARCTAAKCGDGIRAGGEQCDDGDKIDNNGCSNSCTLTPADPTTGNGFDCKANGAGKTVCTPTVCGDGVKSPNEQCDDGNLKPYDGCSPTCTIEPACQNGSCTGVCGDGLKFPNEACDDGNLVDGDGCDHTCAIEDGFTCGVTTTVPKDGDTLDIPILYRDFLHKPPFVYNGTCSQSGTAALNSHPDFENLGACNEAVGGPEAPGLHVTSGLVNGTLDSFGKPTFNTAHGNGKAVTNEPSFWTWYHDTNCTTSPCSANAGGQNPLAIPIYAQKPSDPRVVLTLVYATGTGVYDFNQQSFFPVDGKGWNASGGTAQTDVADDGKSHNFSFTSELHYPFTYQGGEKFTFTGDDDVWIFVNGKLAVDIGGVHSALNGNVTLDANAAATFGLTVGGWYEIAMFQAERHVTASTYHLQLSGFRHDTSTCAPVCGDGKVKGDEVCDDGTNDGAYGHCAPGCHARGPYCGDAKVEGPNTTPKGPEACDDGVNLATYGGTTARCGPGCVIAPYCGDGIASNGEACDDGVNDGSYGHCGVRCTPAARCGDHVKNGPEQCDDGINNGATGDPCSKTCQLSCGNGVVDPGEQCDDGAGNTGGYGKCNPNCTLGPRCGDGAQNGTEQCDDGKNDGTYGTCNPNCTLAGYCGDGTPQTPPEGCDQGKSNSASAYGQNACTNRCTPAPYCGDKQVDGQFGEVCDDGVNSGKPGSCTPDCKGFVALPTCGNGTLEAGEQCDDGTGKNGAAGDPCDVHCHFTCGNGFKDPGETCDDGVDDGSYGGCTKTCQLAAYCGDGIKNGNETCDNGSKNQPVSTGYGAGVCTVACSYAPYCGDGRVQTQFGEQCDGASNCSGTCKIVMPH